MIFNSTYVAKFFVAKNSVMLSSLLLSFSLTLIIETIAHRIHTEELAIVMLALTGLCFMNLFLSFVDFITGVIAARNRRERISSGRVGNTVGKFFGLILYLFLSIVLVFILSDNYFVLAILYGPLILNIFKEFISIGENLQKRNGRTPYIFTVINKIFDIIEKRFFSEVEKKVSDVDVDDILNNNN